MRAVMISIQPKWVELIVSGIKTIEVRKTRPKIDTPFKCYIYCSKSKPYLYKNPNNNELFLDRDLYRGGDYEDRFLSGKVIGEFVCDYITSFKAMGEVQALYNETKETCLSHDEIVKYANGRRLYYWHISQLKIYDKPKELGEFYSIAKNGSDCCVGCIYHETPNYEAPCVKCFCDRKYLISPPQSWCYVEE
jgi:predicted transcriptional regulator